MSPPQRNLTQGTLSGLSWVYGSSAAGAVMQIVYTAVMARLLAPEDFGLVAMALVFQRFGTYFARMGVGQALIQKRELSDLDIRVGFTTSVLLGVLFTVGVLAAAPAAAWFFDTDAVTPVVRALAVTFLLDSLGRVSTSLLRRDLRFRTLAIIEFSTFATAYLVIGIGLALAGFGVWSLVAVQLAQATLGSGAAFVAARHPLRPSLDWPVARRLYGYGSRISIISFLEFIGSNLDTLIIGRATDQERLGQYNRAFLLVNLPFHQIVTGLSRVLFPSFAQIQDHQVRLRDAYRSAIGGIAAIVLPVAAGLAVAAPEVVRVAIGPQWDLAARVLPLLAFAGAINFLSHLGGVVCDATATLNRKLVLQVTYVALLAGLLLWASTSPNLLGYAAAVLVASFVRHLLYLRLLGRVLGFGTAGHVRLYAGPVLTAVAVGGSIAAVTAGMTVAGLPLGAVFAAQVVTGAVVLVASGLYGPLAPVRHDVRRRLEHAGVLAGGGRAAALANRVLNHGR